MAQARAGLYPDDLGAELGEERLNTFFTGWDVRWQVAKRLREMIVFAHHSIIKDPPFSRLDLLVCRNFLIYLDLDMQKRLISLFHMVLKPGGFLFLAPQSVGATPNSSQRWTRNGRYSGAWRAAAAKRPFSPLPLLREV